MKVLLSEKSKETIAKVAPTDARILVTGENGTGKELVARWLHELSNRALSPLIEVNCAAIPSELIESEVLATKKDLLPLHINKKLVSLNKHMEILFF